MALHTKSDFANLCGISTRELAVYASPKRGKVVVLDGYINDTVEPNLSFLQKYQEKNSAEKVTEVKKSVIIKDKKINSDAPAQESGFSISKEKTRIQIENLNITNQILTEKLNKIQANVIPIESVKSVIQILFKNTAVEFRNGMEKTLTQWSKQKGFTIEEIAEARGKIIKYINESIQLSIKQSIKDVDNIVSITANKKEVGERE